MSQQPRISQLKIWENFQVQIHKVLINALTSLANENQLPIKENLITRKLHNFLVRFGRQNKEFILPVPVLEANNQPDADDIDENIREKKTPDITYSFYDELEEDDFRSAKHFIIECKRLGKKTNAGWHLNKNYVLLGLDRFISTHQYAKGSHSAIMIGYIQNMEPKSILDEVNIYADSINIKSLINPKIKLVLNEWDRNNVNQLISKFERDFSESPFTLYHFWIDIRHIYKAIDVSIED